MGVWIWIEARRRVFLGSEEAHVAQSQPMTGMPTEVEVPRKLSVKRDSFKLKNLLLGCDIEASFQSV